MSNTAPLTHIQAGTDTQIARTSDTNVIEREAPNLLRDVFPYSTAPLIIWQDTQAGPDIASLWITDTTFRDGQQAHEPFTPAQIVHIFDLLHRIGGPSGLIRQSEFFLYSELDRQAVRACQERGFQFPEVTGWIRAVKEDFRLVRELNIKETGILTSVSDYHIFKKLRKTRREALYSYLDVVGAALEAGITPRCHFEDVTRADLEGFVLPFARELMRLGAESGVPIKIRLCDTMGVAVPWSGVAQPRGVPALVRAFIDEAGVPGQQLEWHGHNDLFKVHANAATAWLSGCAAINGTALATGERTGNEPIEAAVFEFLGLAGNHPLAGGVDTLALAELADYLSNECGLPIPINHPLLGAEAHLTRAGVHIDGLLKDVETYSFMDTAALLGRPLKVGVGAKSGIAGVVYWVNARLNLLIAERIGKDDPRIRSLHAAIEAQFAAGRTADLTDTELETLAREHGLLSAYPDRSEVSAR